MHNPPKGRPLFRHALLAGVLSLAVLGGTGCDRESSLTGHMRVRHGEVWEDFPTPVSSVFLPKTKADATFSLNPVFTFCNSDDLSEERRDDARGLCVYGDFDSFAKGSGPEEYVIDGAVQFPAKGYEPRSDVYFEPGLGHTSGLKEVWTRSFCLDAERDETTLQQLSGRLVLEENSEDRLRGHLELTVEGQTGGTCPGDAAEVDLDFDLEN
ncbi:hypothetical protein D7Y27_02605 [Corallococcus sp. AB004]|uniref:hypothetical protein n=1 Tax=Corallococcus exiguus TaxID=83462 RepID=UPI000EA2D297|nr:hypothetical protein [Corallococcus exiguus]NPC68136.1 hypothetical protein [Corallococcus exiguus]RKI50107.1 hypothetical protein D7Y27_02605 [Corallococcus sp. AB004]